MADLHDGEIDRDEGLGGEALRPQERGRRLLVLLSGVAESVGRDRAPNVQAPAQAPRRRGQKKLASGRAFPPSPSPRTKTAPATRRRGLPCSWPSAGIIARTSPAGGLSEKLDGVRAYWDGKSLISRLGNRFHAPDWFLAGLPDIPLDGELWIGRKAFQRTVGIVRRQDKTDLWKQVRYVAFDAPAVDAAFEGRLAAIRSHIERNRPPYLTAHEHAICTDLDHLRAELARIEALGGEGSDASPARIALRGRPVADALEGQDLSRCRSSGAGTLERCRPAQGPARCTAGGAGQWNAVLGRHRLLRRRARSTAAGRLGHHVSLSGAFRRWRAAVPVVRRCAERCCRGQAAPPAVAEPAEKVSLPASCTRPCQRRRPAGSSWSRARRASSGKWPAMAVRSRFASAGSARAGNQRPRISPATSWPGATPTG